MERALGDVGYAYEKDRLPSDNFARAIDHFAVGGKSCVVLIDEYDDPVAKFTKMSVFSAISNLVDLANRDECASMLGYTEEELDRFFPDHIKRHAALMGLGVSAYRAELRRIFNGYRFWKRRGENVYNPVSVNQNLGYPTEEFQLYWTKTGRPSMLMNFMERGDVIALNPESVRNVDESEFDVTDLAHLKAMPMLYQTGYLTK